MKYWVIKGNPRWYTWDDYLAPYYIENWGTRPLPADFTSGDRLFLWESGGKSRIIGFGEVVRVHPTTDSGGRRSFDVRYLTSRLPVMPGIKEIRKLAILGSAGFLQPGPFATVYPLSLAQAQALYRLAVAQNSQDHIWRDLGSANTPVPPPDVDPGAWEGRPELVTHLQRERDPNLANRKKAQFRQKHAKLFCEACGDDCVKYGELAGRAFEVHHLQPLGSVEKPTETRLSDLAILCACCHRVIHRIVPMPGIPRFKRLMARPAAKLKR